MLMLLRTRHSGVADDDAGDMAFVQRCVRVRQWPDEVSEHHAPPKEEGQKSKGRNGAREWTDHLHDESNAHSLGLGSTTQQTFNLTTTPPKGTA